MNDRDREPPLSEMLEDPLTHVLMLSDGVDEQELRDLIAEARERLAAADDKGKPRHHPSRGR